MLSAAILFSREIQGLELDHRPAFSATGDNINSPQMLEWSGITGAAALPEEGSDSHLHKARFVGVSTVDSSSASLNDELKSPSQKSRGEE